MAYTYTGREWDKETRLYYYRARYYDPMEGRFISKDPKGFKGGINKYAYSLNNPVNWKDPFGLETIFDGHGRPIPYTKNKQGVCELTTPIPGSIKGMQEYMAGFVADAASYVAGALTALATDSVTLGGYVQTGLSSFFNMSQGNPPNVPHVPVDFTDVTEAD